MRVRLEHAQCSQRRDGPQQSSKTLKGKVHWEVMNNQHEEVRDSRRDAPEKNQLSASSVNASHNHHISSQSMASQLPSAPFNIGSGMNKEIPLSISSLR